MILKPEPPLYEQDKTPSSNDRAKGGYSLRALERLLADDSLLADWFDRTEQAFAYYDGDNVSKEMAERFRKYNLEQRTTNLVARVINSVLGQEEKSRRDPKLEPDDDEFADVADVLSVRLKEAQRETNADMEIGSAYASQAKGGLGWIGVARRADPFQYQYLIEDIPWREMRYDRRAKRVDLSDAAWVCRMQWKDLGDVIALYPDHEDTLREAMNGVAPWDNDGPLEEQNIRFGYGQQATQNWFRTRRAEWMEGNRERIRMYEVEYKVPAIVAVMRVGHRWIVVDEQNPAHVEAISRGMVKLKRVPTQQIRRSIFAGPVRLSDEATQLKRFSKVAFFAFRRDSDYTPYGLIEGMISPQDDYNESSVRMRWMLHAQQLIIDNDALDTDYNTVQDIVDTMMRPDMVAVLNKDRRNANALTFRNDFTLQKELIGHMQDSKLLVQDVPGIYNAQMGNGQPGTSSGIAISSLVEQGMVSMGELNGNYASARRVVYEMLLDLIAEDHAERDMVVPIGSGKSRREVILNTQDPQTGRPMNMVKDAPVKVGLGEVPSSPAYQMQMSQLMGSMITALAGTPQAGVLIPTWVEQTSAFGPGRKQLAEDMRAASGMPSAGDRQGAEQMKAQQAQQAAQQAQMAQAAMQAEIAHKAAMGAEVDARTQKIKSETLKNVTEIAATTAANEDRLIEQALQEALAQ